MAELTQEQKDQQNAQFLKDHPQLAERIAGMVNQAVLAALGSETQKVLAAAREEVDRKGAAASLGSGKSGKPKMSQEQLGEYFMASLCRMANRAHVINPELDADGLITQALTGAVGSAGGYTIPEDFDTLVHQRAEKLQVVWPLVQVDPTTRDVVTGIEVTGYITPNEGTAAKSRSATTTDVIAVTEPVFAPVTFTMRASDARVPIHLDLLDDSAVNIMQLILRLVTDGFVRKREYNVIRGTGAAGLKPVGLLNAETGLTAVSVADVTHLSTILGFMKNIPQEYRRNATVLMGSTLFFTAIATLAENVRAAQFLVDALPPIKECGDMPEGKILGGDFKRYVVKRNVLMKMVQSTAAERWTLETCFQEKYDGKCVIKDAFRIGNVTSY